MDSPVPVSFITTGKDLTFAIALEAREEDAAWLNAAWALLDEGLKTLGVGAKTNAGYGRLVLDEKATRSANDKREREDEDRRIRQALNKGGPKEQMSVVFEDLNRVPQALYDSLTQWNDNVAEVVTSIIQKSQYSSEIELPSTAEGADAYAEALKAALLSDADWKSFLTGAQSHPELSAGPKKGKELGQTIGIHLESSSAAPSVDTKSSETLSDEETAFLKDLQRRPSGWAADSEFSKEVLKFGLETASAGLAKQVASAIKSEKDGFKKKDKKLFKDLGELESQIRLHIKNLQK